MRMEGLLSTSAPRPWQLWRCFLFLDLQVQAYSRSGSTVSSTCILSVIRTPMHKALTQIDNCCVLYGVSPGELVTTRGGVLTEFVHTFFSAAIFSVQAAEILDRSVSCSLDTSDSTSHRSIMGTQHSSNPALLLSSAFLAVNGITNPLKSLFDRRDPPVCTLSD